MCDYPRIGDILEKVNIGKEALFKSLILPSFHEISLQLQTSAIHQGIVHLSMARASVNYFILLRISIQQLDIQ